MLATIKKVKHFKDKTFLALFISFCVSFIFYKIYSNSFSLMRLTFFLTLTPFLISNIFKKRKIQSSFILLLLLILVLFRVVFSSAETTSLLFVFGFFCLPILIQFSSINKFHQQPLNYLFRHIYFIQLFLSFFYLLTMDPEAWRFIGYTASSTTYTVYLVSFFTSFIFSNNPKYSFIHFLVVFYFIFLSSTRSTIIILTAVYLIYFFRDFILKKLKFFSVVILGTMLLVMPITSLFSDNLDLMNRYEGDKDYSTFTRIIYFTNQLKALEGLSIKDYLVGKGVEENKKVGYNISEFNFIEQHNDFFVLIFDYGIIIFIIYLFMLFKQVNSPFSLALLMIYLTSFYHNMLYDFWVITLFFISSKYYYKPRFNVINKKKVN
jgi:hypothetical protein